MPESKWAALAGLGAALVAAATYVVQVPVPATRGYINLGDTLVIAWALAMGPSIGGFAGGVGSALADLIGGYPHWVPFTLVIKGIEGTIAGISGRRGRWIELLGAALAVGDMVLGYFVVETMLYGFGAALAELPGNLLQAASGLLVGIPLARALRRVVSTLTGESYVDNLLEALSES